MSNDEVDSPPHYTSGDIECIDAIKSALTPEEYTGMLRGNIMKYIWRAGRKGGTLLDYMKAKHYLDRLIALQELDLGDTKIIESRAWQPWLKESECETT